MPDAIHMRRELKSRVPPKPTWKVNRYKHCVFICVERSSVCLLCRSCFVISQSKSFVGRFTQTNEDEGQG